VLSEKMERVLAILRAHKCPSSIEIAEKANVCSARDWIRHLRDRGFKIETLPEERSASGARVVRYQLIEVPPVEVKLPF
jgi:hypothetical protein